MSKIIWEKLGKNISKKFKKCTNILKNISQIFIEISAKTLDFTKSDKRFRYMSKIEGYKYIKTKNEIKAVEMKKRYMKNFMKI